MTFEVNYIILIKFAAEMYHFFSEAYFTETYSACFTNNIENLNTISNLKKM